MHRYDNVTGMNKAVVEPRHELKAPLRIQWDFSSEVRNSWWMLLSDSSDSFVSWALLIHTNLLSNLLFFRR